MNETSTQKGGSLTTKDITYVPNEKHVRVFVDLLNSNPKTKIVMAHVNGEN